MQYLTVAGVAVLIGIGVWFLGGEEVTYERESEVVAETVEVETLEPKEVDVVQLIKDTFPEDAERALAIAKCESGFNPQAKGPTQDGGVFQIHIPSHGQRMEELGLDIWDPEDNVRFARILYDEQGWRPWVCHTRGLAYST